MNHRWIALLTLISLAAAQSSLAEPQGSSRCDSALLPQITISEERVTENLAYLMLIDESNYESEKASGKIGVVLKGIPMNASFDKFREARSTYAAEHQLNYSRDEARSFFRQELSESQLSAWTACMLGDSPGVRILMQNDDKDGVDVQVHYIESPGRRQSFVATISGGHVRKSWRTPWATVRDNGQSVTFSLDHGGTRGMPVARDSTDSIIRLHVDGENMTDSASSRPSRPVPPAKQPEFRVYVTKAMIKECESRGRVCAADRVSLGGVLIEKGVIYTQPGPPSKYSGGALATFDVYPGARVLRFTVGNYNVPLTPDCQDPHKTPMNVSISIDGVEAWPPHSVSSTYSDAIIIPKGAKRIELHGTTTDGPYDCDDSVWANVRFDD